MKDISVFREVYESGNVVRCHTMPFVFQRPILSQHQWGTAMILLYIAREYVTVPFLELALTHDAPEGALGDVPATAKWEHPEYAQVIHKLETKWSEDRDMHGVQLSQTQYQILRIADMLDFTLWAYHEVVAGNAHLSRYLQNGYAACLARLLEYNLPSPIPERCGEILTPVKFLLEDE